jgi:hypothetical protein
MVRVRTPVLVALATAAIVLAASACGGGDDRESLNAQTQITADDQRDAEQIVLQLGDFPSGWRAEADGDDEDDADCLDVDFSDLTITGEAESKTFVKGNAPIASSKAAVYQDTEQAGEAFERIATDELAECFSDYMKKQSDDDVTVGDVSFGELTFPKMGDRSAAYQIAIELRASGITPTAYVDLVFIQHERALVLLAFVDIFTAFDQAQKEALAGTVAKRMGS